MSGLSIRLFGRLSIERDGAPLVGVTGAKVQELWCYLLLHRNRSHAREALASRLWGDAPTAQSKKYLRQALWQLQSGVRNGTGGEGAGPLVADAQSVRLETEPGIWLDVEVFERAALLARTVPNEQLDAVTAATVQAAVELYRGDLLEGWYQEWCLYERERLQDQYLMMLDKLGAYCEAHGLYDDGVRYATASLRYDRARECAHQRLMRLHALGGDRAAALRQYDRCIIALDDELGVKPSAETASLYERIGAGDFTAGKSAAVPADAARAPALTDVLGRLRHLETALAVFQEQVRTDIEVVQRTLARTASAAPTPSWSGTSHTSTSTKAGTATYIATMARRGSAGLRSSSSSSSSSSGSSRRARMPMATTSSTTPRSSTSLRIVAGFTAFLLHQRDARLTSRVWPQEVPPSPPTPIRPGGRFASGSSGLPWYPTCWARRRRSPPIRITR